MKSVIRSVDVQVPVRAAYNQWTQFESFPAFMDGVEAVHQTGDRTLHWVTNVAGARREFDAEITEQHPDERVAWRTTGGDPDHGGVVTFHRLGAGQTRVTVQLDWQPQGLAEKAGAAVGLDRHQIEADLDRFKTFVETRGAQTGGWRGDIPNPDQRAEGTAPVDPLT